MDFSWHLFFSLWIYDSMKVARWIGYFCVELFGFLLRILKRWDRSDAFRSPVKEPGSLEKSHPLQMGNKKESRLSLLSCPHQLLSKSVIRLNTNFNFETSVTSTDNQSVTTQFWGVAQVQKDKSSVVAYSGSWTVLFIAVWWAVFAGKFTAKVHRLEQTVALLFPCLYLDA